MLRDGKYSYSHLLESLGVVKLSSVVMTKMAKEQTFRTIVREVRGARYSGTISNGIFLESGEVYSVMNERIKVVTRYFVIIVLCLFVGKGFFYCVRQCKEECFKSTYT